ncbi:MAG: NAD-glutamate dehydrogenase [Propioniciclava sp.]|uniref:NAD-glutamate dehydrogenase n=1 Tax=Propioniciclava sp. TaxID=2038686 RepID=UPI0039E5EECB
METGSPRGRKKIIPLVSKLADFADGELFAAEYLRYEPADGPDEDPETTARVMEAHLEVGRRRMTGEELVRVSTPRPETDGWGAGGSTLVQIVTDDRPFIVATCTMILADEGWTIRGLRHPILSVRRDADGVLTAMAEHELGSIEESWVSIAAYPPLGSAASEVGPKLRAALLAALEASRAAHEDLPDMLGRVATVRGQLVFGSPGFEVEEVREVADLLGWLAEERFEFFGYRAYRADGDTFVPVEGSGLGILREPSPGEFHARRPGSDDRELIVVTRDSRRSMIFRSAFLDYIGVRTFGPDGRISGEHRFLGLFAPRAFTEPLSRIPWLRERVRKVSSMIGLGTSGYSAQTALRTLESLPHDLLFQTDPVELAADIASMVGVEESRRTRLFVRPGRYGRFWTCLLLLPRDRYRTDVRERVQELLLRRLGGSSVEFQASVTESPLARLIFLVKWEKGKLDGAPDLKALESAVATATRSWIDDFNDAAAELPAEARGVEFGEAYEAAHTAKQAVSDLRLANELATDADLRFALYKPDDREDSSDLRFKVITRGAMTVSRVLPHLDSFGLQVIDERPYLWDLRGTPVWLYDFGFKLPEGQTLADWTLADRTRFSRAFEASYTGRCHPGALNRLVMRAGLTWQQVTWLRGMARYLQQAGIPYSQPYVAAALNANPVIAGALVSAFETRFDPAREGSADDRREGCEDEIAEILDALDAIESLDQDRILRMFVAVLRAIQRTNAFADDQPALAFKIAPAQLDLLPEPRPAHEIFVYSPRVQGVHMRYGAVARGGLRWSDRREDFRTEVLGLVKAQMVKNTVIVPVGAKGGFVPQNLPDPRVDRGAWMAEGIACYKIFIASLLSLTDNLVDGVVVPPPDVVRHDGDDTYLVVAADKGTASFSDIANAISVERGFWLGDAFASGGSVGYDHKGMGITARGAWESVKRHFYELGVDCQNEDFTCVGIGDMSGDVFGNGMLLSPHTRLVGAFNHLHIFLDPDPDAAASLAERQRLFDLPRSTWADYDPHLISEGGGVYPRTAKAIHITPQVRARLGIPEHVTALTPTEMIRAMLTAPVDLLWNGGIGTYVKASTETHAEVGDKANDGLRVDGRDVRARVAGEGGNLGWTQAGRIEYACGGGRINTDFIDNSAGVDTSDHEVNIKVLLSGDVASGRLGAEDRAALLASMTDEVAGLVLVHNVDQNLALSIEQAQRQPLTSAYEVWMRQLEDAGALSRELEGLPTREQMQHRIAAGERLTRPELASLLAWTKIYLEQIVTASSLPDDAYLADRLVTYFPRALRERYADAMATHPLKREIVTMVTVNRFVNSQGITAYSRLASETSSDVNEVIRAQLAARTIFQVARHELALPGMGLASRHELRARVRLQQLIERAARWLLHNRRGVLDIKGEAAAFTEPVAQVLERFDDVATPHQRQQIDADYGELRSAGVAEDLAHLAARSRWAHQALGIVDITLRSGRSLELVQAVYQTIILRLGLDRVNERVIELDRSDRWDTMARAALRDDVQNLQSGLTRAALDASPESSDPVAVVDAWVDAVGGIDREAAELAEITSEESTLARMSVALRTIRTLLV